MKLKKVVFETNSEVIYKEVTKRKDFSNWKINPVLHDVKEMALEIEELKWIKVKWGANLAADWVALWLANQFKKRMCISNWVNSLPSSLVFILDKDGLPVPPT